MSYLVLARKWRPKVFNEVVGQQHVLRALINGLDQDRLHHAFLFSGTRGVGKTTLARILAKSLNCEQGVSSQPCGECQSCQEVDAGRFVDLIEVDAASRTKVDDTRELLDNVQYAPSRGRYKVYLIDEVHMLSTSSFNALLKTLEEPPSHVKFLFATTDPQKLPVTILSRCMQFNLRRIEQQAIADHLAFILKQEQIEFEQLALKALARAADGSMRDALSLLDQAISFGSGKIIVDDVSTMLGTIEQQQLLHIVTALIQQDGATLLQQSDELSAQGRDFNLVLNALLSLLQRLATLQLVPDMASSDEDDNEELIQLSTQIDAETVQLMYQIALHGKRDLPYAADPKSGFDMTLLRMLSFQPKVITAEISSPTVTSTAQTPAVAAQPEPEPEPEPEPMIMADEFPAEEMPPMDSYQSAPVDYQIEEPAFEPAPAPAPAAIQIAPPTSSSSPNSQLSADNWPNTITALKLAALSRQLANNSAFIKFDGEHVHLSIAPEHSHLATEKAKDRLETALTKHLNHPVSVIFNKDDTTQHQSGQTLASQQTEQRNVRQQQAKESIHSDPAVDALKSAFNGRVIESTIKPLTQAEE
ncbi:MAG: DNA polymerase III subunit gamma/tau [Gammaproteobacteria bacterium]|nr:MAG: DNA polymerase III subunit gamma/tau [Gammaproteobacteria bacterium]